MTPAPGRETERGRLLEQLAELRRLVSPRAGALGGLAWQNALARVDGFELAARAVCAQPALLMTTVDALQAAVDQLRREILG